MRTIGSDPGLRLVGPSSEPRLADPRFAKENRIGRLVGRGLEIHCGLAGGHVRIKLDDRNECPAMMGTVRSLRRENPLTVERQDVRSGYC